MSEFFLSPFSKYYKIMMMFERQNLLWYFDGVVVAAAAFFFLLLSTLIHTNLFFLWLIYSDISFRLLKNVYI